MVYDLETAGRWLFRPDRDIQAEIALVFGMSAPERPAERAADLYHRGLAPKLLFTGGANPKLAAPEAVLMAERARAAGVPPEAMLIEDKARFTQENVRLSHNLLETQKISAGSILIVTMESHLARCILAVKRWFPAGTVLGWSCYPSRHYRADDWETSDYGRAAVASELDKIIRDYGIEAIASFVM